MVDLATMIMCGVFVVFVIGPLILVGILVDGPQTNLMRWRHDRGVRAVAGTIAGTWVGLFACLEISNFPREGFETLLIVFVAAALFGGLIGWYGDVIIHGRRVKQRLVPARLELLQPAVSGEV